MAGVIGEPETRPKAGQPDDPLRAGGFPARGGRQHYVRPAERRFTRSERATTTILWGGLTLAHEELVTEAMRGLGYRVQHLPCPDNEAMHIGKELGNRGQCNPTYYTVGNLIRYLRQLRDAGEQDIEDRYVFVTGGACGPCRFGMYEAEYRKALRDAGFGRFRVLVFHQSGGFHQTEGDDGLEFNTRFALTFLKGLMLGDLVNDLGYKIRPYEVNPGETDSAMAGARAILGAALRKKRSGFMALRRVRKLFNAIEVDYTRVRPKVKVTGEFWAQTTEGDGNYRMFRWLESEGAEVLVEPVGTWIEYLLYIARQNARERELKGDSTRRRQLMLKLLAFVFRFWYDLYRRALGFRTDPLPSQDKLAEYAAAYCDTHLRGGEGHLEIGKNVMATRDRHAHMVISLKPFGCMPSTMSDGVQTKVVADYSDAIFLPVETSGDAEINVKSRVQMKLYEARMRARQEVEDVLAREGVTLDDVRAHAAKRRRYRNAMRKPAEDREAGISTAAQFVAEVARKIRR